MFHLRTKKNCAAIVESSHLVPKETSIARPQSTQRDRRPQ